MWHLFFPLETPSSKWSLKCSATLFRSRRLRCDPHSNPSIPLDPPRRIGIIWNISQRRSGSWKPDLDPVAATLNDWKAGDGENSIVPEFSACGGVMIEKSPLVSGLRRSIREDAYGKHGWLCELRYVRLPMISLKQVQSISWPDKYMGSSWGIKRAALNALYLIRHVWSNDTSLEVYLLEGLQLP